MKSIFGNLGKIATLVIFLVVLGGCASQATVTADAERGVREDTLQAQMIAAWATIESAKQAASVTRITCKTGCDGLDVTLPGNLAPSAMPHLTNRNDVAIAQTKARNDMLKFGLKTVTMGLIGHDIVDALAAKSISNINTNSNNQNSQNVSTSGDSITSGDVATSGDTITSGDVAGDTVTSGDVATTTSGDELIDSYNTAGDTQGDTLADSNNTQGDTITSGDTATDAYNDSSDNSDASDNSDNSNNSDNSDNSDNTDNTNNQDNQNNAVTYP